MQVGTGQVYPGSRCPTSVDARAAAGLASLFFAAGDGRDDAEHVMQIDVIAGFEVPGDRLGTDAREPHLALGVVGLDEIDVERQLAVDADGLNAREERMWRPLEHARSVAPVRGPGSGVRDPRDPVLAGSGTQSPGSAGSAIGAERSRRQPARLALVVSEVPPDVVLSSRSL